MKLLKFREITVLFILIGLTACGGGGGSGGDGNANSTESGTPVEQGSPSQNNEDLVVSDNIVSSSNSIEQGSSSQGDDNLIVSDNVILSSTLDDTVVFKSIASTSSFLSKATFGPGYVEIQTSFGGNVSSWLLNQFSKTRSQYLPIAQQYVLENERLAEAAELRGQEFDVIPELELAPSIAFWTHSITGEDQLRQRMTYALSQILVVSTKLDALFENPLAVTYYQDLISEHAFGNYRDLLEAITYSPAMANYLSYLRNEKGDSTTGRVPDENFARELMQLFSIGLVELNQDGSEVISTNGDAVETYNNDDITGLAKVFTGLSLDLPKFYSGLEEFEEDFEVSEQMFRLAQHKKLKMFESYHSKLEKVFLGLTIPAGTNGTQSIKLALDHIANHKNVAPFIGRQLIQRFVTSHPSADYVNRVSMAFNSGLFSLPNGVVVGEGRKGDLKATLSAVLLDPEHLLSLSEKNDTFGKIREPVLRFTHWARTYCSKTITPRHFPDIWDLSSSDALGQHPFASPSVFNFYRPSYVAPGTVSGSMKLTVPELQIVTSNSIPGYANFMTQVIFAYHTEDEEENVNYKKSFSPDYSLELSKASNLNELVDHLDMVFTHSNMSESTKSTMISILKDFDASEPQDRLELVQFAVLMLLTSPDYLVQN